jgi:hypothetical protein
LFVYWIALANALPPLGGTAVGQALGIKEMAASEHAAERPVGSEYIVHHLTT